MADGTLLSSATKVYHYSSHCKIDQHRISCPEFGSFCIELRRFKNALGEICQEEYWRKLLSFLNRFQFEMSAAPVSFNHADIYSRGLVESLKGHLARCDVIYPSFAAQAQELLARVEQLAKSKASPLLDYLIKFPTAIGKNSALVLKESRLIRTVESEFALRRDEITKNQPDLLRAELIVAPQLRGSTCYRKLFVIGPSFWFPEYVFNAPRALEVHILQYSWIKGSWSKNPVFVRSFDGKLEEAETRETPSSAKASIEIGSSTENALDANELLPTLDWNEILNRFTPRGRVESTLEQVDARLLLLEDDFAVFIEASEGSKALIIDLEENLGESTLEVSRANNVLKRISVSDVEPEMFILLRTGGGGDYIAPLADKILGEQASYAREVQSRWKSLLRDTVRRKSLLETSILLLDLGSTRANEVNVRNWLSSRNIKPQEFDDFNAVMRLVGLEDEVEEYWKVACAIDRAHRRAGHHIRKLLLRQVLKADLKELERMGRMDFELSEADGGSLTAFRITDVSPEQYLVSVSRIGHPFERYG